MQKQIVTGFLVALLCFFWIEGYARVGKLTDSVSKEELRSRLLPVLRESAGVNFPEELLKPIEKMKVQFADGKEIEMQPAWFSYLGDMHIRFVMDDLKFMRNLDSKDLEALGLTPEAALEVAVANLVQRSGEPTVEPFSGGALQVVGKDTDLNSSYFLYKKFWNSLLLKHPEGLVACVAKRGGLLYVPFSDKAGLRTLERGVEYLWSSSERMRVSSALYMFKDGKWSVYKKPVTAK